MFCSHARSALSGVLLVILASFFVVQGHQQQPHIIHILADDLGWAEVGFHNVIARAAGDVQTPNIDALVEDGLELDRFYTEKICSPTRSSLLSGRHGIHVNQQNVYPEVNNPEDLIGGYQGIPLNMSTMAEKLHDAGYVNHLVGKWDVGMATDQHSPAQRGFDTWLGYWHHSNDYWTQNQETCHKHDVKDLWRYDRNSGVDGPALDLQNGEACSVTDQAPENGERCEYEESMFASEVTSIIRNHAASSKRDVEPETRPLFLFYSAHLVHMPLQPLEAALTHFAHVEDSARQQMHAMVWTLDSIVGDIVSTLKETGMWENTLLVFHSDNGGEIMTQFCGGNNFPLRGGKFSQFEGGIRTIAAVSGGVLPDKQRGKKVTSIMSVADWYSTYLHAAGVSDEEATADHRGAKAGLPAVDSANCWPMILGDATTCRTEIPIGDTSALGFNQDGQALVGALVTDRYKLVLGAANKGFKVSQDVLTGPFFPNRTDPLLIPELVLKECGTEPANGCLYDLAADPAEEHNLAASSPDVFMEMLSRIQDIQGTAYSPVRGHKNPQACEHAEKRGYYWGPFL
jgi:arylsulfatase I/J